MPASILAGGFAGDYTRIKQEVDGMIATPRSPVRALAAFNPKGWSLTLARRPTGFLPGAVVGRLDRLLGRPRRSWLAAAQPPASRFCHLRM